MPTFEKDIHTGRLRPMVDSNDIARKAIKKRHLSDEVVEELYTHVKSVSVNGSTSLLPDKNGNVNIVVSGGGESSESIRRQVENNTKDIDVNTDSIEQINTYTINGKAIKDNPELGAKDIGAVPLNDGKIPMEYLPDTRVDSIAEFSGFVADVPVMSDAVADEPQSVFFNTTTKKFVALAGDIYYSDWVAYNDIPEPTYFGEKSADDIGYIPTTHKVYHDIVTEKLYRWGGSELAVVNQDLALGETETTAYSGDKGKKLREEFDAEKIDRENKDNELERTLQALVLGAKASCVVSPNVIHKNTATEVSVTGSISNVKATAISIEGDNYKNSTDEDTGSFDTVFPIQTSKDITFIVKATYNGAIFPASAMLYAVDKIFYGAGTSASAATNVASPRRTPAGTYSLTTQSGDYVWWSVPSSMSINKATLNGFNFPIKQDGTTSVDGVSYKIYKSENQYSASTMNIVVS